MSAYRTITEVTRFNFFSSFVDRDMVMRYHWGLAIGHIYGHKPLDRNAVDPPCQNSDDEPIGSCVMDDEDTTRQEQGHAVTSHDDHVNETDSDLEGNEQGSDEGLDSDGSLGSFEGEEDFGDDVDALAFEEMYGLPQEHETYEW